MSGPALSTVPAGASSPAVEQLRAARVRLTPPGAWLGMAIARDQDGRSVGLTSADAVQWSGLGALMAVAAPDVPAQPAWAALRAAVGRPYFTHWEAEDGRTQAEVLAAFDAAIAALSSGGRAA